MSTNFRVLVGTIALTGALAFLLLRSPTATHVDTSLRTDTPLRRGPETATRAQRLEPPEPRTLVRETPNGPLPPAVSASSPSEPAVSLSQLAQDVQLASPEIAGHIAEAESDMAAQSKDPLRSAAMETRIFGEIAQKSFGLQMTDLQVDCRITLCRVQFVLPKNYLERKFGSVPRDAVWTGREPVGFFIEALDLNWRYTAAFGGLDRYGSPVVLGYVAMPAAE